MKYGFIARHAKVYPLQVLCRVLDVSTSGYYDWRGRGPSARAAEDAQLLTDIRRVFAAGRRKYGSPKVWKELRKAGKRHSRKRIARLMAKHGLLARKKRRFVVTTRANPAHTPAPNVLDREFRAEAPNTKWVSDITDIPTDEGKLYLAVTLDLFSRMVVGWSMAARMQAKLTRGAFGMAVQRRQPDLGFLHHSDRGSQYTDGGFRGDLRSRGAVESMSRKGNVWDNAVMESFFAQLEIELLSERRFATRDQARQEVFDYIEVFYNRTRSHSTLGYVSPAEFEEQHAKSGAI